MSVLSARVRGKMGKLGVATVVALGLVFGVMSSAQNAWSAPPTPGANQVVLTFPVNGTRDDTGQVQPPIGATLDLVNATTQVPFTGDWATCTVTADGCSFVIPLSEAKAVNGRVAVKVSAASAGTWMDASTTTPSLALPSSVTGGTSLKYPFPMILERVNPSLPSDCFRSGLRLGLVADLSGSMGGNPIATLKAAGSALVDAMEGTDSSIALFTFSGDAPAP
ncbi:MAG: hypothetical protein FWF43_09250, partial [Propionibacteriaceae bacterium]|nr:hypothetical protein [Propionibacteriaceae bacterium]